MCIRDRCGQSTVCTIYSGSCDKDCKDKYTSRDTCTADAKCSWDYVDAVCGESCNTTNAQGSCAANGACMWAGGSCQQSCRAQFTTQGTCDASSNCMWNATVMYCQPKCDSTDSTTCSSNSGCRWTAGKCDGSCKTKYGTNTELCTADTNCAVNPTTGTCTTTCADVSTKVECDAVADLCSWNSMSSKCIKKCRASSTNPTECGASSGCEYDNTTSTCLTDCDTVSGQTDCESNKDCVFFGRTCKKACGKMGASECRLESRCQFDNTTGASQCVVACGFKYGAIGPCGQDPLCMWDATKEQCRPKCTTVATANYPSKTPAQVLDQCSKDTMCKISANQCIVLSLIHISEPTRLLSISYAVFCLKKKKKKEIKI
eukprot:TRINITY_DN8500_c0_g1_i5.p1 TRINITY_DN8500_c0_g1~~TRINITY_DN8500_c0_g1_i5.p1  ORF type:complete len:373 (+),score=125.29 TRINITY_DN8500_c0_g1_i5:159-1277(+)